MKSQGFINDRIQVGKFRQRDSVDSFPVFEVLVNFSLESLDLWLVCG